MRRVAACAVFAVLLLGSPLAAQEPTEPGSSLGIAAAGLLGAPKADLAIKQASAGQMPDNAAAPETAASPMVEPLVAPASVATLAALGSAPIEPAATPPPPPITLVVKADLGTQRVSLLENGVVKHVWPISSGRSGYATPTGTFRPQWASKMWYSRQYDMAPMPHAVFFNGGMAFHGTSAVGMLGRPASHGCVRLHPAHAKQLYAMVHKHGYLQTKVVVQGGSRKGEPSIARRKGAQGQQIALARKKGNTSVSPYTVKQSGGGVWGLFQ